jgi:hypothetical protein
MDFSMTQSTKTHTSTVPGSPTRYKFRDSLVSAQAARIRETQVEDWALEELKIEGERDGATGQTSMTTAR